MLEIKIDFRCKLCENNKDFYIMPVDEIVNEKKETVPSGNIFRLMCKKCKKSYIVQYEIRMV